MSIRAIVVDDEPLARDELRFMLGQCEDIEVVGEARNAPEAQDLCKDEQPDVAFLDLRMPAQRIKLWKIEDGSWIIMDKTGKIGQLHKTREVKSSMKAIKPTVLSLDTRKILLAISQYRSR